MQFGRADSHFGHTVQSAVCNSRNNYRTVSLLELPDLLGSFGSTAVLRATCDYICWLCSAGCCSWKLTNKNPSNASSVYKKHP